MQHFSSERWTDFVRDALNSKDAEAMQAHLDNGCEQCTAANAAWKRVFNIAGRESVYQPPSAAVKMAKAAMKLHREPRPRTSIVANLLFDSMSAPVAVGVRSAVARSRQLLYGFEDYRVDLRLEPNFDADHALLVGQILHSKASDMRLEAIRVSLIQGGKVLGSALTNEFGEFQLECDLSGRLELQLTLPNDVTLRFPIIEPTVEPNRSNRSKATDSTALRRNKKSTSKGTRK
jgi:hypothetical protein